MRSLLIVALLAAPAAATDKFTHTAPGKVDVTLSDRLKPPPKKDEGPPAPTVGAEQFLQIEELLGEVHQDQLAVLVGLAKTATDTDERADLMFRIAEMNAKLYRMHHLRAVEASIAHKDGAKETEAAKQALVATVKAYHDLTEDEALRAWSKMDVALFYYGYTLHTGGYRSEARKAFARLLEDFPRSKFVPEAHLAFGEAAFEAGQLADAEQRYRYVIKFPSSSVYGYALYKLGWVQLNQGKPQDALETFYKVAQLGTKTQLFRAAKRDFVRAYAEVGRADKALAAFKRVDPNGGFEMLTTLADLYLGQGKHDKAIYVYREMLHERPGDKDACLWEYSVARAMLAAGSKGDRVHEIEELVRLYGALKTRLPKAEAAECKDVASEMSGQLARAFHQEAVKTKNVELAGYAERLYRAYEKEFADGDTRYWHAELRWALAELEPTPAHWEDAARAFDVVTGVDGKLTQIAADAAMLAWMKALAVDPRVHQQPADDHAYEKVASPRPIPAREQQLLAAYDRYLDRVRDPKDDERVDVMFHKANLLRRYDHHAEAMPIFVEILAKHRDHETAEWSAQLLLDGYNRLQQYDKLVALAGALATDPWTAKHDSLKGVVAKIQRQALRRGAEALEKQGQETHKLEPFIACANQYVGAYNLDIDAADADELLYNAGVCFEEGKSMGAARLVYENLAKLFPNSKLTARSVVRLGNVYASTAYYREASETFEAYAVKYGGEKDAYGALSDAVAFRKGIGDDAQAIADTERVVRLAKAPGEAATAFWSLAAIYEKRDLDAQIRHLKTYLGRYRTTDAVREIAAYTKLGQALWAKACPVALVDGTCAKVEREVSLRHQANRCGDPTKVKLTVVARDRRLVDEATAAFTAALGVPSQDRAATYYHAAARLGLAERDYEAYLGLAIPANLDFRPQFAARAHARFDSWLLGKRDVAVKLRDQYAAVAAFNDGATAIAAASRLGQVFESFSGQLFRAEVPAVLRTGPYAEEATQAYCDAVTAAADPLEVEAKKAFDGCLTTATRLGWFSEASKVCERELGQLDPAKWPTASEVHAPADQIALITATEGATAP